MGYRDELGALEAQKEALRAELETRGEDALELAERLLSIETRLRVRRQRALDRLHVASPCDAAWEAMEGDGPVRRCHRCEKNVYDIAGLSTEEAVSLIEREGPIPCMRLHRRADGTVITADCPLGRERRDWRGFGLAGGALLSAAALALTASPSFDAAYEAPLPQRRMGAMLLMGEPDWPESEDECDDRDFCRESDEVEVLGFDEETFLHGWQEESAERHRATNEDAE